MRAPNGRLFGDGSAQARRHGEHSGPVTSQIFFVSIKCCCGQKHLEHVFFSVDERCADPEKNDGTVYLKSWIKA